MKEQLEKSIAKLSKRIIGDFTELYIDNFSTLELGFISEENIGDTRKIVTLYNRWIDEGAIRTLNPHYNEDIERLANSFLIDKDEVFESKLIEKIIKDINNLEKIHEFITSLASTIVFKKLERHIGCLLLEWVASRN